MIEWFTGTIMQLREPHTKIVIVGTLRTNRGTFIISSSIRLFGIPSAPVPILSHELSDIQIGPSAVRNGKIGKNPATLASPPSAKEARAPDTPGPRRS